MKRKKANAVRLYRFYNWEVSGYGEPFALCDKHFDTRPVPATCILNKMADRADWPCEQCTEERR